MFFKNQVSECLWFPLAPSVPPSPHIGPSGLGGGNFSVLLVPGASSPRLFPQPFC